MTAQLDRAQAEQLARSGAAALQAGNATEAIQSFERLTAAGVANTQIWLLLAHACNLAGDRAGAERAADAVLDRDKQNLRALIVKGDCRLADGDERAAGSFYSATARLAVQAGPLPDDLAAEVVRADTAAKRIAEGFRGRLEQHLAAVGLGPGHRSPRFSESIEILLEEKQVYLQQPTSFYFPRLPQIQFFEREDFPWVEAVEAATGAMIAELEAALGEDGLFRPYLQARKDRPSYDFHGLLDNPAWSTLYLWENGGPVEANVARFPRTFAALGEVPMPHISTRAPSILFSLLQPGARIAPHNGVINTRLICHLPLIVPEKCGFRVGNEVREWEVGKLLIFDDTIEHEAWNDSDQDRVVLIFDVWRPELSPDERRAVAAIFDAIDGPGEAVGRSS